jgi:apolipoprotein D and lipocalin family protein
MKRFLAAVMLAALAACATGGAPPPATVQSVDLQRYAGRWYEIARYPNEFQDGRSRRCEATTADYAARPDGTIAVVNTCRNALAGGEEAVARGSAYAVQGSGNAKLRVTFFWPFYGDYWVIGLDPEYRWAVVGAPGRDYLWILSRTPQMSSGDYSQALAAARAQGFDAMRLQPTLQPNLQPVGQPAR